MSTPTTPLPTYRITLPAPLVSYLLNLAKNDYASPTGSKDSALAVISKLSVIETKIANAGLTPAYLATPRETIEQKLGMHSSPATASGFDKEAYWEDCYNRFLDAGKSWISLSITEMEAAKEHMYLNDLMSPEEIADFEGSADISVVGAKQEYDL